MVRRFALRTGAIALGIVACHAGCAPVTVSFTLFADNARLDERVVQTDRGAGDAKVALIDVRGLLADRAPRPLLGPPYNPVDELAARLTRAADDPAVRALVLRINSPGGTVTASDVMFREIRRFAETTGKPVVASLGEVAASGGYYVALAADRILAEPTTITGSIGVIIPTLNVSEGLGRIGIRSRSVASGPNKDLANPLEPMREEHYRVLQGMVDEYYARFRTRVVERRGSSRSLASERVPAAFLAEGDLDILADGRVMTGSQAAAYGLVDATGGVREAFELAKQLAGIPAARLVKYYRRDADQPRSPYAAASPPAAEPPSTEINFLHVRVPGHWPWGDLDTAGAYYLWIPPG